MNRYLFKAKRKDNNEWVYGTLEYNFLENRINETKEYFIKSYFKHEMFGKIKYQTCTYEIIPETLCQCTGLQDVDGKDIFENDIISSNANLGYGKKQKKVEIISQVIYLILNDKTMSGLDTNQCSMFTTRQLNKEQDYTNMDWSVFFNCKIIGNKFDKEED